MKMLKSFEKKRENDYHQSLASFQSNSGLMSREAPAAHNPSILGSYADIVRRRGGQSSYVSTMKKQG